MDYSQENNKNRRRKSKSKKKKVKNKTGIIIFRIFIALVLIGGFAAVGAMVGVYMGIIQNAPRFSEMNLQPQNYTTIVYTEKEGVEIDRFIGEENREYVNFAQIPDNLKNAFVAIEDQRFYSHNGIDFRGIVRAAYSTLSGNQVQGASTITQQLIKNNVTGVNRNTVYTKLQEQYLAVEYEKALTEQMGSKEAAKNYILEVYLNTIGLHHRLNGVQTASWYYFNKDVSELSLAECAVIAAITQNPSYYAPDNYPDHNRYRQMLVLDKMLELEYITQAQFNEAEAEDVYGKISAANQILSEQPSYHSFYIDQVYTEVVEDLKTQLGRMDASNMVFNGGLQIFVPMDVEIQAIVDEAFTNDDLFSDRDFELDVSYAISVRNGVTDEEEHHNFKTTVKTQEAVDEYVESVKSEVLGSNDTYVDLLHVTPQPQAAMAIIDYHNGYVKAIAGSRGEKLTGRAFNRATQSKRSPGSVFKVLASYLPALDMGIITPATVIEDAPYTVDGHNIRNWWGNSYRGFCTVRDGIRESMNILAVKNLMENTGIDNAFDYLLNMGFTTLVYESPTGDTDRVASLALGGLTDGVTQVEVTAAYGAIANLGEYHKPKFYTKVLDHDGNLLLENTPEPKRVIKSTTAYLLTDMMNDVVNASGGTGGRARFKSVRMPVVGKTGTTTDTKDLTFVGYTPYYVAGIWLGYDQQKEMSNNYYHLELWRYVMEQVHEGLEYKTFERPDGIVTASFCRDSGKLAVSGLCDADIRGSRIGTEIFAAGTQPSGYCDVHVSVQIDRTTNMKAGQYCPPDEIITVVGVIGWNESGTWEGDHVIPQSFIDGPACTFHNIFNAFEIPEGLLTPTESEAPGATETDLPTITPTPTPQSTPAPTPHWTPRPDQEQYPPLLSSTPQPTPTPTPTMTPVPEYPTSTPPPQVALPTAEEEEPVMTVNPLDDFDY